MEKNKPFKPKSHFENSQYTIFDNKNTINHIKKLSYESTSISEINKPQTIESNIPYKEKNEKISTSYATIFENKLSKKANEYQTNIDNAPVKPDPTLPDNHAAYRRLNEECNRGWKLNPSDIADFYLLTQFIGTHASSSEGQEDSAYMATETAKTRVHDIGKRLLIALSHEQLEEYDRHAKLNVDTLPPELRKKVHDYTVNKLNGTTNDGTNWGDETEHVGEKMNLYLSDFQARLDEFSSRDTVFRVFDDPGMVDTALQILQNQQSGTWKVMATAMRAFFDPAYPLREVVNAIPNNTLTPEKIAEFEETVGGQRESFLIDRLFNYVHETGHISARIMNNLPRSLSLLVAHGAEGMSSYLLHHSSILYGFDYLSKKIYKSIPDPNRDVSESMVTYINGTRFPRDYAYALLLEFNKPQVTDALRNHSEITPTPTNAFQLLRRVAKHDGHSLGRIKKKKE